MNETKRSVPEMQKICEVIFPRCALPRLGWGGSSSKSGAGGYGGRWHCDVAFSEDGTFAGEWRFVWEVWQ